MTAARPPHRRDAELPEDDRPGCSHCGAEAGAPCGGADAAQGDASQGDDATDRPMSDEDRIAQLDKQLADAQEQRLRLIAEYQTSQRRALESEARARIAGVAQAVRHVIPVIDNLDLALGQTTSMTTAKAIEGLSMLRTELNKAVEKSGVEKIEPKPGDEFDPHQHEAVMRQPSEGIARDSISVIFQPGYRLGETVLRPAKVAVAP